MATYELRVGLTPANVGTVFIDSQRTLDLNRTFTESGSGKFRVLDTDTIAVRQLDTIAALTKITEDPGAPEAKFLRPLLALVTETVTTGTAPQRRADGTYEDQAVGGGGGAADASTTTKGISKMSVAPASATNPIAVGTNDARVTADQAAGTASIRTLGGGSAQAAAGDHVHAASAVTFTPTGTVAATNVQSAIAEVASESAGIPASLLDVKGDLIAASAADTAARLPAGANNQLLIADSAQSLGVKWAVPAASTVSFAPTASIAATEVQAAIAALEARILILEGDTTPISPAQQVWPVINTSVLGASYAPLAYPAATTKRYIDAQAGNDANDGTSWATAWKGLYNAWETTVSDPGAAGVEIWCRGTFDLTDAAQYYPSSGQLLVANVIDGTATAPRSVRAEAGCQIIKGWVTLRTPAYNRVSGFVFDGQDVVADQLLKIEGATATGHFEYSYNVFKGGKDQGVIIDTGLLSDVHGYCNRYENMGNYRHPDGTRGHFDQPIYVKKCPRFLEVNPIFINNIGGYGLHAYDSATSDPANAGRLLHGTSVGQQPFTIVADTVNASAAVTVVSAPKTLRPGMVITGSGIPANAQIDSISGSVLTMSANSTATASGVTLVANTPSAGGVLDGASNFKIINNIFKDYHGSGINSGPMGRAFVFNGTETACEARKNLVHNCQEGIETDAGVTETGTLTGDPLFVNPNAADFHLQASSPAKNAGENWGVLVDHYGQPRSTTAPSIGAIE